MFEEEKGKRVEIEEEGPETAEEGTEVSKQDDAAVETEAISDVGAESEIPLKEQLDEQKEKYLRLYADLENYRKKVQKDKDELVRYTKESVLYELLPSIDNLEEALKHAGDEPSDALVKGVEASLRELQRTMEKFGLKAIDAYGKKFNPAYHHAMTQVERDDVDENMVVEEFRKGYMYGDKVLRAALVAVSSKPSSPKEKEIEDNQNILDEKEES